MGKLGTVTSTYSLGRESADDGSFRRQESQFRRWVSADAGAEFPAHAGRYHLYVARACPWAHRTIIARRLMGLEDAIGISFVDPIRDERGWAFTGGRYIDDVNGFAFLSKAYMATDPAYAARVTVPVLWDKESGVIVSNESADILRMLGTVFAPLAEHPVDLYPEALRDGDRRPQLQDLRERQQRRIQGRVLPPPGGLRAGGARVVRDAR